MSSKLLLSSFTYTPDEPATATRHPDQVDGGENSNVRASLDGYIARRSKSVRVQFSII